MTPNTTNPQASLFDDIRHLSESETHVPTGGATNSGQPVEMRSSRTGIAHMVAQLTAPAPAAAKGVGGRHGSSPPPRRGGGYLDKCDVLKIRPEVKKSADPRFDELVAMGLQGYWLQVAQYLGVDAFLAMWRILDANRDNMPETGGNSGSMSPTLRRYSGYLRFQKNRFVENLAAQGLAPKEIQQRVQTQLCESISIVNIRRLANKHKIKR